MAIEVHADTYLGPWLPGDAIAVLFWHDDPDRPPNRWRLAAVVTGADTLRAALKAVVERRPDLDGKAVLGTKVGGRSGEIQVARRNVPAAAPPAPTVTFDELPAPPAPPGAEPAPADSPPPRPGGRAGELLGSADPPSDT